MKSKVEFVSLGNFISSIWNIRISTFQFSTNSFCQITLCGHYFGYGDFLNKGYTIKLHNHFTNVVIWQKVYLVIPWMNEWRRRIMHHLIYKCRMKIWFWFLIEIDWIKILRPSYSKTISWKKVFFSFLYMFSNRHSSFWIIIV